MCPSMSRWMDGWIKGARARMHNGTHEGTTRSDIDIYRRRCEDQSIARCSGGRYQKDYSYTHGDVFSTHTHTRRKRTRDNEGDNTNATHEPHTHYQAPMRAFRTPTYDEPLSSRDRWLRWPLSSHDTDTPPIVTVVQLGSSRQMRVSSMDTSTCSWKASSFLPCSCRHVADLPHETSSCVMWTSMPNRPMRRTWRDTLSKSVP
mmetsp:Transcript_18615/g.53243  ORF Transcript_18615/g.53243 Transcript_18615/m.53243 type:complete len:203 (-) Transcript_18615:3633-4241(-)